MLTSSKGGGVGGGCNFAPTISTQTPKKPTQIRVNWPNFIACLNFCEILGNMCNIFHRF